MPVTYSVCVSGSGIDYSRVTSVSYTYSDYYIKPAIFDAVGYAIPDVRLRVSGIAVTDLVHFCGGGTDSFLGFEYVVVSTLASPVFEYFLRLLLHYALFAHFGFVGGHMV